jgi:hypothetical protein
MRRSDEHARARPEAQPLEGRAVTFGRKPWSSLPQVNPQLSSWLPTLVAVPLVGFMLYRRLRRTFGRQPVTQKRMALRIVLLCAVCILLIIGSSATTASLGAAAAGLMLGVALAMVGLTHTEVESTAEGNFREYNGVR